MELLKLSPSKLEVWRKYKDEEYNGTITKEKVIEAITGAVPWSPAATFGACFHLVMQYGARRYLVPGRKFDTGEAVYHVKADDMPAGMDFCYDEIEKADQFHDDHPAMVWEIPGTIYLDVDNFRAMINYRIDAMEGLTVHENKTSGYGAEFDFYEASVQWRIELLGSGADRLQYNVFAYDEPNSRRKVYQVDDATVIKLTPYHGMADDIRNAVRGLVQFCQSQGLMDRITVKSRAHV